MKKLFIVLLIVPRLLFAQYQTDSLDAFIAKEVADYHIPGLNGKGFLELLPSKKQFSGYLYYLNKDTLKVAFNDGFVPAGEVIFTTDKNGRPAGFRLDINSSDFLFKYLDFKKE